MRSIFKVVLDIIDNCLGGLLRDYYLVDEQCNRLRFFDDAAVADSALPEKESSTIKLVALEARKEQPPSRF